MAHQVILQPDGLLSVWSTVVDDLVIENATKEELLEFYAEQAASDARYRTEKIIDKVLDGNAKDVYSQFTMTYEKAKKKRH